MTTDSTRLYQGEWRNLGNPSADSQDSIHEDRTAREYGFKGGLVTGSIVATRALPAVVEHFGPAFFEDGWYAFRFIGGIYEGDPVREYAELPEDGSGHLVAKVEKQDSTLCAVGRASLGTGDAALGPSRAWDPSEDGQRGADLVMHDIPLGASPPPLEFTPTLDGTRRLREAAREDGEWYTSASPWGGPIAPPEQLMHYALGLARLHPPTEADAKGPPIWSHHALVMEAPLLLDRPYVLREWLADKGRGSRTVFLNWQFEVTDPDGRLIATGRHRRSWFAAQPTG